MSYIPIDTLVPEGLRASVRGQIAAYPNPAVAASADEIADLVFLAVTDAVAAIDRVVGRSSSHGVAMAVLSGSGSATRAVLGRLEEALISYAEAEGGAIYETKVNIGGAMKAFGIVAPEAVRKDLRLFIERIIDGLMASRGVGAGQ